MDRGMVPASSGEQGNYARAKEIEMANVEDRERKALKDAG